MIYFQDFFVGLSSHLEKVLGIGNGSNTPSLKSAYPKELNTPGIDILSKSSCFKGSVVKERNHILPPCKQRWVSAACIVPSTAPGGYDLVCGDRAGSLHLYHKEVQKIHMMLMNKWICNKYRKKKG